ncbi:MAG: hypothetical protein WBM44_27990 [Waterburya sp.]
MQVSVAELRSQRETLNLVAEALYCGKKVIFRLIDDRTEAEFMNELGRIAATTGTAIGILSGFIGGLMILEEIVGFLTAGPAGVATAMTIGGLVGSILGTIIGYSLGAWLAHFIYGIAGKNGEIKVIKLCDWFGLRKNRVQVRVIRAS